MQYAPTIVTNDFEGSVTLRSGNLHPGDHGRYER
jgi:hypothetical protein